MAMTHRNKISIAVGLALAVVIPFSIHSLQAEESSPPGVAQAAQLTNGWQQAPVTLPNMVFTQSQFSSGGSSSWAVGIAANPTGATTFSYTSGGSTWQTIASPVGGNNPIFTPAYPETGTPNSGWLQFGATLTYFNGNSLQTPVSFNAFNLSLFSSQGNVWAVGYFDNSGIQNSVISAPAGSATWSAVSSLPFSGGIATRAAASGPYLYVLGVTPDETQYSLVKVDTNNKIESLTLPSLSGSPLGSAQQLGALVFAQGNTVFVMLPTLDGNTFYGNAYYSLDGGMHWISINVGLPQFYIGFINNYSMLNFMTMVHGVVIIPPTRGNMGDWENGAYLDLTKLKPAWQVYPAPNNIFTTQPIYYSSPSSDGHQQCLYQNWPDPYTTPPVIDCYDFTLQQWLPMSSIPSSYNITSLQNVIALGNDQFAVIAEKASYDGDVALYYDSHTWVSPVSYPTLVFFQFATNTLPYFNPNNVWIFGSTMNQNKQH